MNVRRRIILVLCGYIVRYFVVSVLLSSVNTFLGTAGIILTFILLHILMCFIRVSI